MTPKHLHILFSPKKLKCTLSSANILIIFVQNAVADFTIKGILIRPCQVVIVVSARETFIFVQKPRTQ